jgi:hypothetical protein
VESLPCFLADGNLKLQNHSLLVTRLQAILSPDGAGGGFDGGGFDGGGFDAGHALTFGVCPWA